MDPYEILGVRRSASESEIKAAYRKKVKELHPDGHPPEVRAEFEKKLREVNIAHDEIKNPTKNNGNSGNQSSYEFHFGSGFEDAMREYRERVMRARMNINIGITIGMDEALTGVDASFIVENKRVNVKIPAGCLQHERFTIKGMGHTNPQTNERGDIVVTVQIRGTATMELDPQGVLYVLHRVSFLDIELGGKTTVNVFGNDIQFDIPDFTHGNGIVELGAVGYRDRHGNVGDLVVRVEPQMGAYSVEMLNELRDIREKYSK